MYTSIFLRNLSILIICLTVNNGYAENKQSASKHYSLAKKEAPAMTGKQILNKMKRFKHHSFPGRKVSYKQLPHKAQYAIKRAYDSQAQHQSQSCASSQSGINNFTNTTRGGTELECTIGEGIIGCWHGEDYFTGCQKVGEEWSCQWNEPIGC